jgi:putative adhesin
MSISSRAVVAAALVMAPFALTSAQRNEQTSAPVRWSEQVSAGHWVRAANTNGHTDVRQGTTDRVEVTAVKRWRRGNPENVRLEMKKVGEDVQICALYGDQQSCENRDDNHSWRKNDDDDVAVDFTIVLPRGARVSATTVNGGVDVTGATSEVEATSVNGDVMVETSGGPLRATTVNGTVTAKVSATSSNEPMTFTTVNGQVTAILPSNTGADVEMTTVNGSFRSDFEITMRGRIDPHNMSLHVGPPGGPRIRLTTVNGDVNLRKP